jgi:site-specific DNA recombinase
MIAAIYARKSTEQHVADEQKSVARQIAHARQYAARKGWIVDEAFVFVDDGISGAEFARRPGFVRLMNALKPRAPFGALIVSELSRLGREQLETGYAVKQLSQAGVRIFSYLDDREVVLDSPTDKFILAATNFAAEMERDKHQQRAVDAAQRKARAGHVTGGRCFGYVNVDVRDPAGRKSHVEQRINEAEAAVVRQIFELAAAGYGQKAIAKRLNAEGAAAPRSQQGRPCAWIQSSVHAVLFRPRYRGELVWNTTKKRDRWGQHKQTRRPEEDWIRVGAEQLRIVPEPLWEAAHTRIRATRTATNIWRPPTWVGSQYLLPGLARCAWCNGGMHVRKRTRSSGPSGHFYACTSHYNRGESVCQNAVQMPMADVDGEVIARLDDLMTPDVVGEIVAGLRALVDPQRRHDARADVAGALQQVERQAALLAEAIAGGGNIPALVAQLQTVDQRRQALARELEALAGEHRPTPVDWRALERRIHGLLPEWRTLLHGHTPEARQVLRALLETPLQMTPVVEPRRYGYRFAGSIGIGEILEENVRVTRYGVPGQS